MSDYRLFFDTPDVPVARLFVRVWDDEDIVELIHRDASGRWGPPLVLYELEQTDG